jgi:hypothetical protein
MGRMSVFELWQQATDNNPDPTVYTVVGYVPTLGTFEIRRGTIVRIWPASHHWRNRAPATFRPATSDDLHELDYAASNGWLQIELRPVHGLIGGQCEAGTVAQEHHNTVVLWQARGNKNA